MVTKLLFVEPPKDYWFLMGEYLSPPTGLLILAACGLAIFLWYGLSPHYSCKN